MEEIPKQGAVPCCAEEDLTLASWRGQPRTGEARPLPESETFLTKRVQGGHRASGTSSVINARFVFLGEPASHAKAIRGQLQMVC